VRRYGGTVGNYIDVSAALLVQIGVIRQSYSDTLSDSVRNFAYYRAGGEGVNLFTADTVILYDRYLLRSFAAWFPCGRYSFIR
jgi:hypothetical protein